MPYFTSFEYFHCLILHILRLFIALFYKFYAKRKKSVDQCNVSTDFLENDFNNVNLLLSKVFTYHRQALQWEILLHQICSEDEDEHRIDEASDGGREELVCLGHAHEEDVSLDESLV